MGVTKATTYTSDIVYCSDRFLSPVHEYHWHDGGYDGCPGIIF